MCTVSMIGDHYRDTWPGRYPDWFPNAPTSAPNPLIVKMPPDVTREEFESLKREVEDMKALLKRAKMYDEANHEPDCEIEEKMNLLRDIAKLVGVDIDDVIGKAAKNV